MRHGGAIWAFIGGIALCVTTGLAPAEARQTREATPRIAVANFAPEDLQAAVSSATASLHGRSRIWCVPYARAVSGISIKGNAATWWNAAADTYPRGRTPVVGAVLNFRASGVMPKGHVAVVSDVTGPREIQVTQANWARNKITADRVVDVSPENDWTQVRVENASGMGRVNPTYGFIYRPAS